MLSLLKILSIRPPDSNAFSSGHVDYRIEGEHVYFDRIDFNGDAVSLRGNGEMNFQTEIRPDVLRPIGPRRVGYSRRPAVAQRRQPADHADARQWHPAEPGDQP